jgi:hypothetical protein
MELVAIWHSGGSNYLTDPDSSFVFDEVFTEGQKLLNNVSNCVSLN